MSLTLRPALKAALAVLCLGLALAVAAFTAERADAARTVKPAVYNADVRAAAGSVRSFALILAGTDSIGEFANKAPVVRRHINRFAARIAKMRTYRVSAGALEARRKGAVRTGPPLTAALRRFVAISVRRDLPAATRFAPKVGARIKAFSNATGTRVTVPRR